MNASIKLLSGIRKFLGKLPLVRGIYYANLVRFARFRMGLLNMIFGNYIDTLNVEISSRCNLKCKWCPSHERKSKAYMDVGLFKKLVDEINSRKRLRIRRIELFNGGESLMHPKFNEFIKIVSEAKKENEGFPLVSLLSNATFLTASASKNILQSGAVDYIMFSVDGLNKKEFESTRIGAKWGNVKKNIYCFLELNEKMGKNIGTGIISIQQANGEMDLEFNKIFESVDDYMPRKAHDWDGSQNLGVEKKPVLKGLCGFILTRLIIHPDGNVTVCCADINATGVIGNYENEDLLSLWNSDTRKKWISLMKKNKRQEIEHCRNCSLR